MPDQSPPSLPVPSGWPKNVKSAVLHVISLAQYAIAATRGWAADALNPRARQAAEDDQLKQEIQLLREELRIKNARLAKIDPRHRPFYPPTERMAILELKAARGWSLAQTARAFLVEPETIAAWLKRADEDGPGSLVQMPGPVNKFPDFVRHIVCRLKVLCPSLGKVKLAQVLARAGLHLCATTVGRMLKAKDKKTPPGEPKAADTVEVPSPTERVVTAKYPDHVWHVDLTIVPTSGFWTAWLPFSLAQRWPFCWWLAVVIDHFSRRVMGVAVFRKQPDSGQVTAFLAKTIRTGAKPKYVICDKGTQFWCRQFKRWCRRRKIEPRFGAVGQYGSLAVIERFIRTLKDEGLRRILVPLTLGKMRTEANAIIAWYNTYRPHMTLGGRTPDERYRRVASACRRPRYEPRPGWPSESRCASPQEKVRGKPGGSLELVVDYYQGHRHLPAVKLKHAA